MAPDEPAGTPLPRLAFVYDPGSFAPLALLEASRGICDLVWVADGARPDVVALTRLLRRTGELVDVAGMGTEAAAGAVRAAGVDGLLALADDQLRFAAALAELLGLPFHSVQCALRLTDKSEQRSALRAAGLPAPRSWLLTEGALADAERRRGEFTFPAVLKPRHGEASRDTYRLASFDELRALLGAGARRTPPRELVLEEYIEDGADGIAGEGFAGYVSVESFVEEGLVTHLAVTGRTPMAAPFRETGFFIPGALGAAGTLAVCDAAAAAAKALGVTTGCLHTEVKLTPAGPVVIEVNGRIGGGVPELLAAASGVAFLSIAMKLALRVPVDATGPVPARHVAFLMYVHAPDGVSVVEAIEGIEEVTAMPGVHEVVLRRGPGAAVDWREGNHGHVLSVFGVVKDHAALREMLDDVGRTLQIRGS